MPIIFPANPTLNQVFIVNNIRYVWDGVSWTASTTNVFYDFVGATEIADGSAGLVPAPVIADRQKFLRADGTWSEVASDDLIGQVEKTYVGDEAPAVELKYKTWLDLIIEE